MYPTYLETTKGFSAHDATIATIIGNCVRLPNFSSDNSQRAIRVLLRTSVSSRCSQGPDDDQPAGVLLLDGEANILDAA